MLVDPSHTFGIVSYGTALPHWKVLAEEIAVAQGSVSADGQPDLTTARSLGVVSKTAPDQDEDAATLATQAGHEALTRLGVTTAATHQQPPVQALFVGSESHPYAVKPTGTVVAAALGLTSEHNTPLAMADLQFACKAGTQGLQIVSSYVVSGFCEKGMAVGSDTAQSRPGDVLEYTAGAGAAAYVIGKGDEVIAKLAGTVSVATDTPDFWRRPGQSYPEHAGRFTGEPAYFAHVLQSARMLMDEAKLKPTDIDWCVFHTPNAKFPQIAAKKLGFSSDQLAPSLIVKEIGNTYAAATMMALAAVLDQAAADQKILVVSYGSGSGSDAFLFETTPALVEKRAGWTDLLQSKIARLKPISYGQYHQNVMKTH